MSARATEEEELLAPGGAPRARRRPQIEMNALHCALVVFGTYVYFHAATLPLVAPWAAPRLAACGAIGAAGFAAKELLSIGCDVYDILFGVSVPADAEAEARYEWPLGPPNAENPVCYLDIDIGGFSVGRVELEVKADVAPRTAANFVAFCSGEGTPKGASFRDSRFHRIVPGFMCQGGALRAHPAGTSIYGPRFDDENFDLAHVKPGVLSMANRGPDTNGTQFFVSVRGAPSLDGKHVVFGQVLRGFGVVKAMESVGSGLHPLGVPWRAVEIVRCGVLERRGA